MLERCHAVVESAQAGYEGITAVASITDDTLRFAMTSDADFPQVMLEAKLCTWLDADGDSTIDASEEPSVIASNGAFDWPAGTHAATATARLDAGNGRVCSRMWFYASYLDGNQGTKRSSIACIDRDVAPPASVPEARHVALLGATGTVILGGAVLGARRRRLV